MPKINYSKFGFQHDSEIDNRKVFNPAFTPQQLAFEIQELVDTLIERCEDVDWNEDFISFSVIKALREILMSYEIPDINEGLANSRFNFEAYKLTGKAEQTHGDIAFIITRKILGSDKPISGVGFYEAKASAIIYEGNHYPSFKIQQLRRLVRNTPKLSYLIYNKAKMTISKNDWPMSHSALMNQENIKRTHAIAIDASFLKQCRDIDVATMAVGQSFGEHFVNRILSGRDLDYSRPVEETIRRWLKCTKRSSPLVVSVSVFETHEEPYSAQIQLPGFETIELPELGYYKFLHFK